MPDDSPRKTFPKANVLPMFLSILKTAKEQVSLKTSEGREAPPEICAAVREVFEDVERLLKGDYDQLSCGDFRKKILK